jgi:hypothetical protein
VSQQGTQTQAGAGVQALGQESWIGQAAFAASSAEQSPGESRCGCHGSSFGNSSDPVRIGSAGNAGALTQSNDATLTAHAPNAALPTQTATQTQSGAPCGCGGQAVQALGQHGDVHQVAASFGTAQQDGARNSSTPTRIWGNAARGTGDLHGADGGKILQPGQLMLV